MNVLDENVTRDQADLLRHWHISFRSISRDLGCQGTPDENIIPLLLKLKEPTLLTRDGDFFQRRLIHARYSLAWFNVRAGETAYFIRRFLFHPLFRTKAQRLGKVLRIRPQSVAYWAKRSVELVYVDWS